MYCSSTCNGRFHFSATSSILNIFIFQERLALVDQQLQSSREKLQKARLLLVRLQFAVCTTSGSAPPSRPPLVPMTASRAACMCGRGRTSPRTRRSRASARPSSDLSLTYVRAQESDHLSACNDRVRRCAQVSC